MKYGYYPEDPDAAYEVDSLLEGMADLYGAYSQYFFTQEKIAKEKLLNDWFALLPKFYAIFEAALKRNSSQDFFVGDNWTLADFFCLGLHSFSW